eukprot:59814_1
MSTLRKRKSRHTHQSNPLETNKTSNAVAKHPVPNSKSPLSDLEQCKQMFAFVFRHKFTMSIHLIATMGHVIARMLFPIVTGFAITTVTTNTEDITISDGTMEFLCTNHIILDCSTKQQLLNTTFYLMVCVNIMQSISNFVRGYYGKLTASRISSEIRNTLFHSILWNDLSFTECDEDAKSGVLLSRLCTDCSKFTGFCTQFIASSMDNIFGIIFGLAYALYISYFMTLIMLLSVPISTMLSRYFGNYYKQLTQQVQTILANATNIAMESIQNIKTVKAFSTESKQECLYAKQIEKTYVFSASIAFSKSIFEAMITIVAFLSIACVLWYGSRMYIAKEISAGNMVSFVIISIQVSLFLQRTVGKYSELMKCIGATKRVFMLINKVSSIPPCGGVVSLKPMECMYTYRDPDYTNKGGVCTQFGDLMAPNKETFDGNIEFKSVCFAYPSRPNIKVIHDMSFSVSGGETVGIVGESGNGKSTLINLLMRFYDPLDGHVLMDGIDLKQYDLRWLHSNLIGYVQQEPSLFNQSIKWNIGYGARDEDEIEMGKVIHAAKKAQCYDFIMKLEHGFDTVCGEKGTQLSGGQKQRIAIARAMYNDPKILILDEASSALDSETEYLIQQSLRSLMNEKKTIMIIAHRLSTVKSADKIIVIKQGQIVQIGAHKELVCVHDGEYYKLMQKQLFV